MTIKTITKADLTNLVYDNIGFSLSASSRYVDSVFTEMTKALVKEGEVKISSFGTFKVRKKNARMGRNPKTKEPSVIKARKVVTFSPSGLLRESTNQANG